MTLSEVRDTALHLATTLSQRPLHTLRLRARDIEVEIRWNGAPTADPDSVTGPAPVAASAATVAEAPDADQLFVTAPAVGVFYRAPSPEAASFVEEGDVVEAGQQVAIVEAMKLMIPVLSERSGRVAAVLKKDGEPVEYGEHLFALSSPSDS